MAGASEFQFAPAQTGFRTVPLSWGEVQGREWLTLGVPLVTGVVGTGIAIYSLSGRADPERLRLTQFFLALLSIGVAFTGAITAIDKVSQSVLERRQAQAVQT